MLVVIIIGVLAAMVMPRFAGRTEQAKRSRAQADLAAIGIGLDLYEMDLGADPASLAALVDQTAPADLDAEARAQWKGPYVKHGLPRDPWGREYQYVRDGDRYHLSSLGADGQPGTDDLASGT